MYLKIGDVGWSIEDTGFGNRFQLWAAAYELNKFNNFKFTYSKKTVFKESKILMVSSKKANLQLNWKPIYNFKDTLNETLSWYEGHINNEKRTHQILDNYINLLNKKIK